MKIRANVHKVNQDVVREEGQSVVRGYADITIEECCRFNSIRVMECSDGKLRALYPQKPVYENGVRKMNEDGKPMYSNLFFGNSKEVNDAIKAVVMEAYQRDDGFAFKAPVAGEPGRARIEPRLHPCNGEKVKAVGRLLVGGYMVVPEVFVNLHHDKEGNGFLSVSWPGYTSGGGYKPYVEPLTKGIIWDREAKAEKEYNFMGKVEAAMKKKTLEFHPELAEQMKGKVDELIAHATDACKEESAPAKAEPEMSM